MRKTPVRHSVRSYKKKGTTVHSYVRGRGSKSIPFQIYKKEHQKISEPWKHSTTISNKIVEEKGKYLLVKKALTNAGFDIVAQYTNPHVHSYQKVIEVQKDTNDGLALNIKKLRPQLEKILTKIVPSIKFQYFIGLSDYYLNGEGEKGPRIARYTWEEKK